MLPSVNHEHGRELELSRSVGWALFVDDERMLNSQSVGSIS
jgi:hypothetical protein